MLNFEFLICFAFWITYYIWKSGDVRCLQELVERVRDEERIVRKCKNLGKDMQGENLSLAASTYWKFNSELNS